MPRIDYETALIAPAAVKEKRLHRRDVDEFLGLCRGFSADGRILDDELIALREWARRSKRLRTEPLVDEICSMIERASQDPSAESGRMRLQEAITRLIGKFGEDGRLESTSLPLTVPPPEIIFEAKSFCFTGTFEYGRRKHCEQMTAGLGGVPRAAMAMDVDYLVIGATATGAWLHSSYGRKIQEAVQWRKHRQSSVSIVSERHWVAAVESARSEVSMSSSDAQTGWSAGSPL